MNKKFDHLEKSVRTLKHDSKFLKEQNVQLTRQVTEFQATVSQLESRTQETEMENERLEAHSRRDNLRFHGFEDKRGETWDESESKVRNYIFDDLGVDESSIRIERAHRIRSKNSPRPIIVKFSHYKDREKVLKAYREKRRSLIMTTRKLEVRRLIPAKAELMSKRMYGGLYVSVRIFQSTLLKPDQSCIHS